MCSLSHLSIWPQFVLRWTELYTAGEAWGEEKQRGCFRFILAIINFSRPPPPPPPPEVASKSMAIIALLLERGSLAEGLYRWTWNLDIAGLRPVLTTRSTNWCCFYSIPKSAPRQLSASCCWKCYIHLHYLPHRLFPLALKALLRGVNIYYFFISPTSSAIARMWYGSKPQQPPIYLTPMS